MKIFVSLFICAFVGCLLIQVNADCVSLDQEKEGKKMYKTGETVILEDQCDKITCHENGSWSSKGCATFQCLDQIGYQHYNYSKPYPECCPRPICKSDLKN